MKLDRSMLATVAQANPGNFGIYKVRGECLEALFRSAALGALSGMTEAEYAAMTARDAAQIVLECDRPRVAQLLGEAIATGRDADLTYRIIHKVHGSVWVHARSRLLGALEGCPVLMVVFDPTSEEAQEHAFLLSHGSELVYVVDRSTYELLYANDAALKAWGRSDYSGQRCHAFINHLDAPCPWCSIFKMEGGRFHADEYFAPSQHKWLKLDCADMDWHGRAAVAIYGTDITAERSLRENLELDKASLQAIISNIPMGLGVCEVQDGAMRVLTVNRRFTDLLGAEAAADFSSANPALVARLHPDDREAVLRFGRELRAPGANLRFDFRYRAGMDGAHRWYRALARTTQRAGGAMMFVCVSDVTAEKEAQNAMLESRRLYEAAVEEARLVVWEYDIPRCRVTMADHSFTSYDHRKFGLPKVIDNVPDSLVPYIDPADTDAFLGMYRALEAGAQHASCDVWYKLVPGQEPRCEHISYTVVASENGRPLRAFGIGQNVTAQKLESEKYARAYRQLADAHPYTRGRFHLNLTSNICTASDSELSEACQHSGSSAGACLASLASSVADADLRGRFCAVFNRMHLLEIFRGGQTQSTFAYPVHDADGAFRWHNALLFLLQNPDSGDVEAVIYILDITEQKKNEEIINHLTGKKYDYVALLDLAGHTIEFRNKRIGVEFAPINQKADYEQWRSYVIERFIADDERENYSRGTELGRVRSELTAHGEYTFAFLQTDGGAVSRRQIQYTWLNEERGEVLVVRTDVTAAYEQEQEQLRRITEALRRAEDANRAKTEFLSRISHDIRTPISIIKSMTGFALEDIGRPDRLRDDLRKIEASNTFLLSLINDVLDISKIDSGKIELQPEPYVLDDYMSNIRNMFEPLCAEKGLHFTAEGTHAQSAVCVDQIRLNQITLNLLSNAVKYTPAGGTVAVSVSSRSLPGGLLECTVEVRDTGIGMSEAFQKTMFEPFSQEYDNPGRPKAGSGTGLGLSIVHRLVELIGGSIAVESRLAHGTCVRVRFTAPAADGAAVPPAGSESAPAAPAPLTGRVLLAEDNEINTEIAVRLLADMGLTADCAENGQRAVELFAHSEPGTYRAVLMDIQMPVLNGFEAAQQLRALARPDARSVPIIAMTADAFSAAMERSRASGMDGYITKPLEPGLLRAALEKAAP